ncbi:MULTISPECIES: dipeptide ABC transporter ATP-binding protein [Streptomyces]|uniref:ABC transporter ATP-binding protein n=1 Tax=Streptomyces avermitilis TaxID=33903 RepID=A0A4D4LNV0_STRAX|nr:ABC transporter ATP-binding protein [Streptomyces avermitilis]MYS98644.1 dipeptide ABC transporter ATP-binding protein [Streptomyces sp. SID5469]BBJ50893.1 ABC transporter ATP-binding protein [Streptomyces avermitilis]GDY62922.1 ABC transporter ATP-binding protein [Streptomyces avermitilis]GDY85870.1 ABC transporter ATP-binding protein [Streptomyces avermitilis]
MTPVLEVARLNVDFDGRPAVRDVSLSLSRGEVLGLVGESGSGKSATALAVLGLLPDNATVQGSVRLDGQELVGAGERELTRIRGSRVAMVFQDPLSAFTPVHRVGDQIAEAVRAHQGVSRERARERAAELLDLVGIPASRVRAFPHEFSGGMRQRAMIAMAMANEPDVILADEPTTALDVTIQAQVLDVLRTAQRETGAAVLLVSHDLGVIAGMADRVAVMYEGEVVESGTAVEVFGRPREPYTRKLLGAVPRLDDARPRAELPDSEPVLRVRGLTKTFPLLKGSAFKRRVGSVYAVDGVDLDIRRGETLALVGESGSGKSTTLFELLELAAPEGGSVELFGQRLGSLRKAESKALRRRVQIVFQDPMASLDPRMPVGDIIAEPLRTQGFDRATAARRVPELLTRVGLDPAHAERFPHEFSGGQRQRIGIARALSVEPELLVLDEPVSALDVSVQAGVLDLLDRLKAELGLAYLFVSHDLSVVRHIADRVSVVYLGRTVESGPVEEVFERPRHPYTQALLSAVPLPDPERERERRRTRILLAGDPPSPTQRYDGCRFRARCPLYASLAEEERKRCAHDVPVLDGDGAACHFPRVREVI